MSNKITPEDLQAIKEIVEDVVEQKLEQKLKPIRSEIRKINRTLNTTISWFDREQVYTNKRVDLLDDHLGLPHITREMVFQSVKKVN